MFNFEKKHKFSFFHICTKKLSVLHPKHVYKCNIMQIYGLKHSLLLCVRPGEPHRAQSMITERTESV